MNDLIDTLNLGSTVSRHGLNKGANFESIYSQAFREKNEKLLAELDSAVSDYFKRISIPNNPTIYDYLVLSLREKDLIVTFNWDPLLPQAFQRWRHLKHLPKLAFLHGNIDIGVDRQKKIVRFLSDGQRPGINLEPSRLLFPVEQKDYNADLFIKDQWQLATDYLSRSYLVTIFGYSAPATDVEAKSLLLNAWKNNPTRELAEIEIIDIRNRDEVKASWADFIVRNHAAAWDSISFSQLLRHPRRSCEAFAFATLQQDPWHEDPLPFDLSLKGLEEWVEPLISEENSGKLAGKPHHTP